MKTRSARLAQNTVQQPAAQLFHLRRSTRLIAQANGGRCIRFASRDQVIPPQPDQDGDSVMGDSEHVPSEDGTDNDEGTVAEDSDTGTVCGDDVDAVMGDDSVTDIRDASEGPQTPTRSGTYNFGSVILTPDKNKSRAPGRIQAVGNDDAKVHSRYPSLNGNGFNHNNPVTPARKGKNRAYVLLPTTPRGVGNGKPARDENIPGPSNHPSTPLTRPGPPATIHRQNVQVPTDPLVTLGPMEEPVRWYRRGDGQFVRDGSLPPEYYGAEHLKKVQPPRAQSPPPVEAKLVRHDTEPLEDPPVLMKPLEDLPVPMPQLDEPARPPQLRPKRKARRKTGEIDMRTLRRSVRIREQRK